MPLGSDAESVITCEMVAETLLPLTTEIDVRVVLPGIRQDCQERSRSRRFVEEDETDETDQQVGLSYYKCNCN